MEASKLSSAPDEVRPNSLVEAPFNYVRSLRANGVRDKFMHALNLWFRVTSDELQIIMNIVSMVHHMALMLDDIQDGSGLRREAPAAHRIYGTAQTINSATHALLMCFVELERLPHPAAARAIFVDEIGKMHEGQASDLNWKHLNLCPTADEYMAMIDGKSGAFFHLCVRLMQLSSSPGGGRSDTPPPTGNSSILDFTNLLGRFFQIRDDYQNLMADDYAQRKGWCDDLDEGKRSLPLIYTLTASDGKRNEILGILARKEGAQMAPEMKRFVLDQMHSTGALDKTMSLLNIMQQDLLDKASKVDEECGVAHSGMAQVLMEGLWI